ncbi:MAG: hypothetical protein E7436_05640 [Ruminococcaceae bacterium]|nr:hypothetical protein [Oscillospiraceae bacterium]
MLFRKKIEKSCSYCIYGTCLEGGAVLCSKKGFLPLPDKCSRFKYDATKRVPHKPKALDLSKYKGEDFAL